jgi:hypothetical protein
LEPHKIWIEQCEAARGIEAEFGTQKALNYLIDEKFIHFLEAAETDKAFRAEIPAFVADIRSIFEPWQLAQCLESARERPPFDPADFENDDMFDAEDIEMERQSDIRKCTAELLMVERAKEWLIDDDAK